MYYYGARYYDPRISIFVSVDPLAEQFVGWTPYHYVHNNPVNLIDPTGMSAEGPGDGDGPPRKNVVILPKNIPSTDDALKNIKNSAEKDLDDSVIKIYTTGLKDLKKQLKEKLNGQMIGTISNHSHGNYNDNSFSVGNQNIDTQEEIYELGQILSPYTDNSSTIILQSCHAGSGRDMAKSRNNISILGAVSGANVLAPMTWGRGSANLFNNEQGAFSSIPKQYINTYFKEYPQNRTNSLNFNQYFMYNQIPIIRYSTRKNVKFNRNGTFSF